MINKAPIKKKKLSLRAQLNAQVAKKPHAGVASYALRFRKTGTRFHINDACHASMRWMGHEQTEGNELSEIALSVSHWLSRINKSNVKAYRAYVKYILNESPWAKCFLTKQVGAAINHGVLMNVDLHLSMLVGAAIALRGGWEYQDKLPLFLNCIKKGYSGHVAYLVSGHLGRDSKDKFYVTGFNGGHQVLSGIYQSWEHIRKFFREGYAGDFDGVRKSPNQTRYSVFGAIEGDCAAFNYYTKEVPKKALSTTLSEWADVKVFKRGWMDKYGCNAAGVKALADKITNELKG